VERAKHPEVVLLAGGSRHVVHDRSSAHVAAWYSAKRPPHKVGEHFVLEDARVWMRLMFWAARETGLLLLPAFEKWCACLSVFHFCFYFFSCFLA
jgi:hypothetical protein